MQRLLFLLLPLIPIFSLAQIGTGQWRMHVATSKATDVAAGNGLVMTTVGSGLVQYDHAAGESKVYDMVNGLSDIGLTTVCYDSGTASFFVGYENGNVDQILSSGNVINIPGIKLAQILGDKRIYDLVPYNGKVYVACGIGIVVIDPAKNEIKDTYYPGSGTESVTDVTFANDSIYGITETKLYRAALSNPFLTDANQWQIDTRVPTPVNGKYWKVDALNDELFVVFQHDNPGEDTLFKVTASAFQPIIGQAFSAEIVDFEVSGGELMVSMSGGAVAYDASGNVLFNFTSYGTVASNPKAMIKGSGNYWVADNSSGLVRMANSWSYQFVRQDGPGNNTAFAVNGNKGKMVVSSGVLDRVVFNFRSDGSYIMEEESWTNYNRFNQTNWQSANVWDFGTAAVNAENPDQVAFGCYCIDGVSVSNSGTVTNVYNPSNSGLEATTLGNTYACISSMEYDDEGNLWIANCYSNKPLKVLKADGNWVSFETGTTPKGVFTSKLVIDNAGNKWMGLYERGLLAYNNNGTIDNLSDDSYKVLQTGTGNGNLPSNNVTAVAVDFDDEIWIGTEDGFVVLYNSAGVFGSTNVDASRILVNFEGNVEQLLDDTPISDIEIDGGNRKWIATASTGIFLLSADGQEVITHFTKENSPLISDNILDMEFDYQTGELFIVTDIGLVSYRSDATQGDPEYSNVTVFPNPVKPDYFGPITIQGIRYDSDVKITDVAGNLVYQTTSNGGTATWNGKTLTGENVPGGIYMIWTATNEKKDGQNKKVAKVAVIR